MVPVIYADLHDSFTLLDNKQITGSGSTIDYDFIGIKNYDVIDNGYIIGVNDTMVHAVLNYMDVAVNRSAGHLFIIDNIGGLFGCEYDKDDMSYFDTGYDDDNYYGCAYGNGIVFATRDDTIEAWSFSVPGGFNEEDTNDSELSDSSYITADIHNNVFVAEDNIINYWNYSTKNLYMGFPKPLVYRDRYDSRTEIFKGLYCNGTHLFCCGEDAIRVFNYSSYSLVNVSYFIDTDIAFDYTGVFYNDSILYSIAEKSTGGKYNSTLTAYSFDGHNIAVINNVTVYHRRFTDIYGNLDDMGRIVVSYVTDDPLSMGDHEGYGYGVMIFDFDGVSLSFVSDRMDIYPGVQFTNRIMTDGNLTFMTKYVYGLDMMSYYHDSNVVYPGLFVAAGSSGLYKYNHTTTDLSTEYDTSMARDFLSICNDSNGTIHIGQDNGYIKGYVDTGIGFNDAGSIQMIAGNITSITSNKNRIYAADDENKSYIIFYDSNNNDGNYTLLTIFDDDKLFNDLFFYDGILYAAAQNCIRAFDVANDTFIPVGYFNITSPSWSNHFRSVFANDKIVFAGMDNSVIALNFTKATNFTFLDYFNITGSSPYNYVDDMMLFDDDELFVAAVNYIYSLYWDGSSLAEITNTSSVLAGYDNVWTDDDFGFFVGRYDNPYNLFMFDYGFLGNPDPPYNLSFTYDTSNNNLNFSWDRGNGSDREVVISSTSGFPTSPTDGTIVQNSTIQFYNTTQSSWVYYTVFSYNDDNGLYSTTGLNVYWGIIQLSCFNESNPSQGIDFDVEITNSDVTSWYTALGCHNIHYIPISSIPYGINTIFVVKNTSGYETRTYFKNIELNQFYNYTFYLPPYNVPVENGTGDNDGNTVSTRLYRIKIIDEYQNPVVGANVYIKRYINDTDSYNEVASLITDGYGEADVYLIPNVNYWAFINKSGYDESISSFFTDPVFYGANYPKTFMIYFSSIEEVTIYSNLSYNFEPHSRVQYDNFTFYYNITSDNNMLEWFDLSVLLYNETLDDWIVIYYDRSFNLSGGSLNYTTVNGTNRYGFQCRFKKDGFDAFTFGTRTDGIIMFVYDILSPDSINASASVDTNIDNILGDSPVFVGTVFVSYLSLAIAGIVTSYLFIFSPKYAGFGIIIVGILLGAFKEPLNIISDDIINWTIVGIVIIIGVISLLIYKKEKD